MLAAPIIRKKRDGGQLSDDEIAWFVREFVGGRVADYQMSALAMAICIRGMSVDETVSLTLAMLRSGKTLARGTQTVPWVDKHSTGGLGDKVSLILAPALACCGVRVPMISGRGLGITGGTLDKLESIPGFCSERSIDQVHRQLVDVGCVICSASTELAPADRRLYALRDVTGTVESIPLITASILSKKLAESVSSLMLDVKVGSGTFMKQSSDARRLATMLVQVGNRLGVRTRAILSSMHQPLGRMIGNTLEVQEAIDVLRGGGPADVRELTAILGAHLLVMQGSTATQQKAHDMITSTLDNGTAWQKFQQMIEAQGGTLPTTSPAKKQSLVEAKSAGVIERICGGTLGNAMTALGGARRLAGEAIDHAVGIEMLTQLGDQVEAGHPLMRVYHHDGFSELPEIMDALTASVTIGPTSARQKSWPLVEAEIGELEA